ncbi:MAG: energy transducer TonB, partial [Muribaculaceae bacterium]|nr:energy transducer TonB [Muribaculaceae bacterium]
MLLMFMRSFQEPIASLQQIVARALLFRVTFTNLNPRLPPEPWALIVFMKTTKLIFSILCMLVMSVADCFSERIVYAAVERNAEYPGGIAAMMKFFAANIRYPEKEANEDIQGRVIVKFIVEADGSISNPTIVKGISSGLDEEALRVVSLMPKWTPGMIDEKAVASEFTTPVQFRLNDKSVVSKLNGLASAKSAEAKDEPQGILKAFGLKGRVKELSFIRQTDRSGCTLYFDLNGNLLDYPNYNGEKIGVSTSGFFYTFVNWKWTQMDEGFSVFYKMLEYDDNNRPILADGLLDGEEEIFEKKNLRISYSGSDDKGNYTQIRFDNNGLTYKSDSKSGIDEFDILDVSIEYWPEDASAKDIPTELSENEAIRLIQQANRKDIEALTEDFKIVIEDEKATNQLLYLSLNNEEDEGGPWDTTILNYGESTNVPDIFVRVNLLSIHDSKDGAIVYFYYTELYDDGTYYKSDLNNDDYYARAIMKFENGEWKVDNITWDIRDCKGHYQDTYDYKRRAKEGNDSAKKYIQSGALEREIKANCAKDSNMSEKLGKVVDFKIKHNLY